MIETSTDVLLIVIACSIGLLTLFTCWAIFYVVSMLRNVSKMTISIREKMEMVDKILKLVHEKLEKGSNHMAMVADSAIKLVGFLVEKQGSKSKSAAERKRRKK